MENCKKIWGTLRSTTSAAISNVLKKTTSESLSNCLSVKKKYKLNVNGSIGKWWFVVRGEKSDIESLVEVWDRVSLQTAWRLEDMFSFADDVFLPPSSSPSIPTNVTIVDKGCSSVPTHVTAVVGNGHAVVNNGHMENNGESTSSLCSEQSATITVVEQSLCTSKHAKHASCQSDTSFAIPSSNNSASADMTPLFFKGLTALQGHSADICSSQLNILYFNARSLLPKLDELRLICTFKNPDIVCVVESWLCCDISDSELSINGYCITRLDRNRHGGGILFFIKTIFHVNVLSYHPFNLELLILRITGSFSFT